MRVYALIFIAFLAFLGSASADCPDPMPEGMLFCYGFEDWSGSVAGTPDYPFSSSYEGYCDIHKNNTQVVNSYDGHLPHTGDHFFIQNVNLAMDPSLTGITGSSTNNRCNLGDNLEYCGQNSWDISAESTYVFYVQFWVKVMDWNAVVEQGSTKQKLLRFKEGTGDDPFLTLAGDNHIPSFSIFYNDDEYDGDSSDDWEYCSDVDSIDDGDWHKVAMMVDYANYEIYMWYDEATPTKANAFCSMNASGMDEWPPDGLVLPSNWSGDDLIGHLWEAVDDIEIWDRLPTQCSGQITEACYCNGTMRGSGYCCNGVWNENACLLIDYGFEDWAGDAASTPGYIFRTSHWETHIATTEATGTCGGVSPRSGSYYFHQQHYSALGPGDDQCLNSTEDPGSVNPHTVVFLTDYTDDGNGMDEIFFHFYFQTNAEFGETSGGYRNKWIELIGDTDIDGWAHFSSSGAIHMMEETAMDWHSAIPWPGGNPHGDGEWHSFAMYVNIGTGEQSVWLDSTDWENPTETRTYDFSPTTMFNYLVIDENFSSDDPDSSCWAKFDDIEIWDGMPTSEDVTTGAVKSAVSSWKQGSVSISYLFDLIQSWKNV